MDLSYSLFFEGLNFRHTLYSLYKSNRPPTPDTVIQGLPYLKAAIKAMSVKVIEVSSYILQFYIIDKLRFLMVINYDFMWRQVPGVEADDVIGTLAVNSVKDGFKVIIWALFLKYLRVYNEI